MKKIKALIFLSLIYLSAYSQRNELGFFCGGSYYLGDINPAKQFKMIHPSGGFFYRYNFNPRFSFKLMGLYGSIESDDSQIKYKPERNLSFKSTITEVSSQIELNFMPYVPGNMTYYFSPYIFTGFSTFFFNPKTEFNGKWYELRPLGTEGQGTSLYPGKDKYSLNSFAIPFGLGLKLNANKYFSIGAEWGLRKTFTDYLDDVSTTYADPAILSSENTPLAAELADRSVNSSGKDIESSLNVGLQRGNSQNKDWYSFFGVILVFKIQNKKDDCPAYQKRTNYKEYKLYH